MKEMRCDVVDVKDTKVCDCEVETPISSVYL